MHGFGRRRLTRARLLLIVLGKQTSLHPIRYLLVDRTRMRFLFLLPEAGKQVENHVRFNF
jgi:hypothetical protein